MSCRVMNRRVEHALLAFLANVARDWKCTSLDAEFIRSARNAGAVDFLPESGFALVQGSTDDTAQYSIALDGDNLAWPEYIAKKGAR
jgi:predicted enzyme involved in methoxymalonyl-ACP biosynthesis